MNVECEEIGDLIFLHEGGGVVTLNVRDATPDVNIMFTLGMFMHPIWMVEYRLWRVGVDAGALHGTRMVRILMLASIF